MEEVWVIASLFAAAIGVMWFLSWIIISELKAELDDARNASRDFERLWLESKGELEALWHKGLHDHIAHTTSILERAP